MSTKIHSNLHPAFVDALTAKRDSFNQRFRFACSQGTALDRESFFEHLEKRVEPIVAAVSANYPERTRDVTSDLYDVSLDLFRTGYFGRETRLPQLDQLWLTILPKLPHLISRDAHRVAGSLSNAVVNIVSQKNANHDRWISELERVGSRCQSTNELMDTSSVLAWRSGMAQLREVALTKLESLPRALAFEILNAPADTKPTELDRWTADMRSNRWWDPVASSGQWSNIREVHRVSGFRGFGGHMLQSPSVFFKNDAIYVSDDKNVWRLFGDCYGWYLHLQAGATPFTSTDKKNAKLETQVNIDTAGVVHWHGKRLGFDYLASSSSQAFDGSTLAITLPDSFQVFLIADSTFADRSFIR